MVAWNINKLLSWVSPEDDESANMSPGLLPTSQRNPTPLELESSNPDLTLSRAKTTDPSSIGLGRARALSRPQYMRSSTLRTIEEAESPHGSYLSRNNSFPPTGLTSPMLAAAKDRNGRSRVPSLSLIAHRRGSKDSHISIHEEDEDDDDCLTSSKAQMSLVNGAQRTPDAGPGPTTLSRNAGPHSPSPSPGRIERRRKAGLQAEARSSGEGSSRDSSPSKSMNRPKTGQASMLGRTSHNTSRTSSTTLDSQEQIDAIRNDLSLRNDTKGKGKAKVMEVGDSDEDCPIAKTGRRRATSSASRGEMEKDHHRRLKVLAIRASPSPEGSEDEDEMGVNPIVLRSPRSKRSRRGEVGRSSETTLKDFSASSSRTPSTSPPPRSRNEDSQNRKHTPDLSVNVDERSRLLGPLDLKLPSVPSPRQGKGTDMELHADAAAEVLEDSETEATSAEVWYRGPLFEAGWKLALMFLVFTTVIVGVGWFALPAMDPADKASLRLPRSFQDLQMLNTLFQKYKSQYPFRIMTVGCAAYLYVQMFSLPGSMYISILFGAAYGVFYGLVLSCLCESFGALLCYALSAVVGPPLLTIPSYRQRLEAWRTKIMGDSSKGEEVGWDGVFAFLIVLRISPFPPHWVANVVAPHLDISPLLFWCACFIGIGPVSVIHVTIGSGLDKMTSAEDFHILSLRNVLGLIGIGVAVMIPTALKRIFKKDLSGLGENEAVLGKTHVHVHDISTEAGPGSQDDEAETSTLRSGMSGRYEGDDSIYIDADLGMISPNVLNREGYYWSSAKKGRGRDGEYMDLDQALGIIQQEEEHEILAVAYPGDTTDSVLGLYEREAAAAGVEEEMGASFDNDQPGALASLGASLSRRAGYGTIDVDVESANSDDVEFTNRKKKWWQVWR